MSYGVMSTPGVVIDGKVVHAGGVPGSRQDRAMAGCGARDFRTVRAAGGPDAPVSCALPCAW